MAIRDNPETNDILTTPTRRYRPIRTDENPKVKIIRIDGDGEDLIVTRFADLDDLLGCDDKEPGKELKITFEEMDKKDFDNLPEWSGF